MEKYKYILREAPNFDFTYALPYAPRRLFLA